MSGKGGVAGDGSDFRDHSGVAGAAAALESKDLLGSVLGDGDDEGTGVGRDHLREDGCINNEEVLHAVDLGVGVDNGSAVLETRVGTHLAGTHPVVAAAATSGLRVVLKVSVNGGVLSGEDHLDLLVGSQSGDDHLDGALGGGKIVLVVDVGGLGNDHVETRSDSGATPGGLATAKVVRQADGLVALDAVAALDTSSPLVRASDAVGANLAVPEDHTEVRSGLRKNAGAGVKVLVGIRLDWVIERLVEVVELDVGVSDDDLSVGVVVKVLADGKVDPVSFVDHLVGFSLLDDLELVLGTDTRAHKNLGGTESTSRENDATAGRKLDVATLSARKEGLDIDTSGDVAVTVDTVDGGVDHKSEVGELLGLDKVGSHRAATLTVGEHVVGVGERTVLLSRLKTSRNVLPASSSESTTYTQSVNC